MSEASFEVYLKINADNYRSLIDELLTEAASRFGGKPSPELIAARTLFIERGLAKGVPAETIVERMGNLGANELDVEAEQLPDKQGAGWHNIAELSAEDRRSFRLAASDRANDVLWDNLFSDGGDDRVIEFFNAGTAFGGKLQALIDAHNDKARELVSR
ncbi:MAG: hypothetical protein PHE27_02900, partial [Alphaproteobacteria bacterium]|nr:hypothetical protein [Alphaproteobacteria bacterium]